MIIALGESILITGATFAGLAWTATTFAAFANCFIGSVAMWVIYFNIGAERSSRVVSGSDDPGRLARTGYTYMHIPIVAGIIVAAVADELTLAHPGGHTGIAAACVILGGPALYLPATAVQMADRALRRCRTRSGLRCWPAGSGPVRRRSAFGRDDRRADPGGGLGVDRWLRAPKPPVWP